MTQHGRSFQDVDELHEQVDEDAAHEVTPGRSRKLQRAKEVARKTEEELSAIVRGMNDRIVDLGLEIQRANQHHGVEWALHVLGSAGWDWAGSKANALRRERLQHFSTEQAAKEIGEDTLATIRELGLSEDEYEQDQEHYQTELDQVLKKQAEATPKYLAALERRQALDTTVAALETSTRAAAIADRPALEQELEDQKREQDHAKLEEATYLAVVKNAQEAIPELQKNRDAATDSIQSLHGMRQSMLEKFANFKVILERATTAMRARARIELFEDMDPAFNAAITAITGNNVATAGASLEVWTERIKQATIDPEKSQALLLELLQHVTDAAKSLTETETAVAAGPREAIADHEAGRELLQRILAQDHPAMVAERKPASEQLVDEKLAHLYDDRK